jgi:pilus assembly protein CpaB
VETKKKRQIIFAVLVGVVGVVVTQLYLLEQEARYRPGAMIEVIVAKEPLEAGKPLLRAQAALKKVPRAAAPQTVIALDDLESFVGQNLKNNVPAGDYVLETYFAQRTAVGAVLSEEISGKNARAYTIPVSATSSLSGSIAVGDLLDMVYTFTVPGSTEQMAVLLLQDVPVIATGAHSPGDRELGTGMEGGDERYSAITLLLSAGDAMKLGYAQKTGTIDIMLRNRSDKESMKISPIAGVRDLLGPEDLQRLDGSAKKVESNQGENEEGTRALNQMLSNMTAAQQQKPSPPAQVAK